MRPQEQQRADRLANLIRTVDSHVVSLPGIHIAGYLDCLVAQLIDSLRRIEFAHYIRDKSKHDLRRMDPRSDIFDPLRAAVLRYRRGESDEAYWLVFIATHFGKHAQDGWRLARDIYGRLGGPGVWDWATISGNPAAFRAWLAANQATLTNGGVSRRFSSHRKYESLDASSRAGTAAVFESYIAWISPPRTHQGIIRATHAAVGQNPEAVFDALYGSMDAVRRFGRLGKFDFLTMLGKLGIAPISPGSAYLSGATGPLTGARLLFGGRSDAIMSAQTLDKNLKSLDTTLNVGMQALEDSLCNWQKSPGYYIQFKG